MLLASSFGHDHAVINLCSLSELPKGSTLLCMNASTTTYLYLSLVMLRYPAAASISNHPSLMPLMNKQHRWRNAQQQEIIISHHNHHNIWPNIEHFPNHQKASYPTRSLTHITSQLADNELSIGSNLDWAPKTGSIFNRFLHLLERFNYSRVLIMHCSVRSQMNGVQCCECRSMHSKEALRAERALISSEPDRTIHHD